jgi:Asp/Glu/hydantoin racemase
MRLMLLNQAALNPKTPKAALDRLTDQFRAYASPGTEIEYHFVDDFPGGKVHEIQGKRQATNGLHHVLETPAIITKCVWAQDNGFDAVIQTNTFDPGVEGARLAVRIPVIGLLRTALHVAGTLGDRIGILAPLESDLPSCWRSIASYQMNHMVVAMRPLGIYSDDLDKRKDEIFEKTLELVRSIIRESGAQVIVPLGAKLIPYVVDPTELGRAAGVPVLNTTAIGLQFAEMSVRLGLTHSPSSYPPCVASYPHFLQKAFG